MSAAPRRVPGIPAPVFDGYALTETGNAERFEIRHGEDFRFVKEWKAWLAWRDGRWEHDTAKVHAREATRELLREMRQSEDPKVAIWAVKSEKRSGRENMLALAESLPDLQLAVKSLDSEPWLIGCPNGVLDLRTGELREACREDYITKRTGVPYVADAQAPRWRKFIAEVTCGDAELGRFLQRAAGYSLTGTTGEQVFFFLYGTGANGKGTFVKSLQRVAGDYSATLKTEALMVSHGQAHPTELVPLFGSRFVTANEVTDGRSWNEARLKDLTGEDRLSVRRMGEDFWDFDPTHKLWISGNYRPHVRGTDHGLWRRVRLVPFNATFDVNPSLQDELLAELAGIFSWAIEGVLEWRAEGLGLPRAVQEATGDYRERENLMKQFVNECCRRHPQGDTPTASLYAAFSSWCERTGERPMSKRGFSEKFEAEGFARNDNRNARGFLGVVLAGTVGAVEANSQSSAKSFFPGADL